MLNRYINKGFFEIAIKYQNLGVIELGFKIINFLTERKIVLNFVFIFRLVISVIIIREFRRNSYLEETLLLPKELSKYRYFFETRNC